MSFPLSLNEILKKVVPEAAVLSSPQRTQLGAFIWSSWTDMQWIESVPDPRTPLNPHGAAAVGTYLWTWDHFQPALLQRRGASGGAATVTCPGARMTTRRDTCHPRNGATQRDETGGISRRGSSAESFVCERKGDRGEREQRETAHRLTSTSPALE